MLGTNNRAASGKWKSGLKYDSTNDRQISVRANFLWELLTVCCFENWEGAVAFLRQKAARAFVGII